MHILFHRSTPWHGEIRCSTQIIAERFKRAGWNVTYMERLLHGGHIFFNQGRRARARTSGRFEDGVWRISPVSVVPFMNLWPFSTPRAPGLAYRSCVPPLARQVAESGFGKPDVIWTAATGSSALKAVFPDTPLCFQVVDNYRAFATGGDATRIEAMERADYARADHIFSIGDCIKNMLLQDFNVPSSKVTVLGQGVDHSTFDSARKEPVPSEIQDLPHPRAVWVGAMDKLDRELFLAAWKAIGRAGGSMILIGKPNAWACQLAATPGPSPIRLLGQRPPDFVAKVLVHSDIGLMLYDQARLEVYRGQNPLKLYEYAAAGLAILSTPHEEFRFLKPPIAIVESRSDVEARMDELCSGRKRLGEVTREFSNRFDWQQVFIAASNALAPLT